MEQTGENEEMPQEKGLSLGIDFGNSKISAAVWDSKRKAPTMVSVDEKYQFPATLYIYGLSGKKEEHNDENEGNDGGFEEAGDENNQNNSSKHNNINLKAEVGIEFTDDKNIEYFIYDIKKLIGQKNNNEDLEKIRNNIKYKINVDENDDVVCFDEKIKFENLAKFLIEKIKVSAEKQFDSKVNSCTISVPHDFNYNQRNAIENAAKIAGINNVYIINDPLSTAIYYASKNKIQKTENFLIIDFGSSKLDITLLTINKRNSIKVKITGGDANLGGDIFNYELQKDILDTYKSEGGNFSDEQDPIKLFLIEQEVEKIKKQLTFKLETNIKISKFDGKTDLNYSIKRETFDEINRDNYSKIIKLINNVIKESNIPPQEINHIILQGDAVRVVTLTNLIKNEYQDSDIITDLYDSVAYGSAIYTAKKLNVMNNEQFKNFKIYDITPFSLGIRGEGDLMSVILPRGSRVPIKVMKYYITTQDNQTNIKFEIFAGERKLIKDNFQLARILLKGLPQMNKGQVKIEVIFEVDENFILHVTAKEISNNIIKMCDVVINECLTQNQILAMIEDSKKHEEEDLEEKERIQSMLKLNDKIFEYSHLYEGNEDILRELESYRNWIKHSTTVPKDDYEKKLKELNDTMIKDKNDNKTRKPTINPIKKTNNKIEEEKNHESL